MIKKRTLLISQIAVICLLIAALLYFLPLPTEVDTSFHGAVVTADGDILKTVDINVDGSKHNYLFKEDLVALRVSTSSDDWQFATPAKARSPHDMYIDVPYMSIPTGIASTADYSGGYYALCLEYGYFIAGRNDDHTRFLVGSTDADTDPATILEFFSAWIDFYFPAA